MYFDEETYLSLNAGFAMVVNLQGKNLNWRLANLREGDCTMGRKSYGISMIFWVIYLEIFGSNETKTMKKSQ